MISLAYQKWKIVRQSEDSAESNVDDRADGDGTSSEVLSDRRCHDPDYAMVLRRTGPQNMYSILVLYFTYVIYRSTSNYQRYRRVYKSKLVWKVLFLMIIASDAQISNWLLAIDNAQLN